MNTSVKMRVAVSVLVAAILCGGCSRKVTAVMAESHENSHDSVAAVSAIRDTLILRDSVATFISGDTVYVRSASVRERLRTVTDTLVRTRRDTVTVIREITPLPSPGKEASRIPATTSMVLAAISILLVFLTILIRKQKP